MILFFHTSRPICCKTKSGGRKEKTFLPTPFPKAHAQSEKNGLVHEIETKEGLSQFFGSPVFSSQRFCVANDYTYM